MIISEKQIMQLMQIANDCMELAREKDLDPWFRYAKLIATLLDEINPQQSSELKILEK